MVSVADNRRKANKSAETEEVTPEPASAIQTLRLENIVKWDKNPRKRFDEAALVDLAASIQERGVLQPILVRTTSEPGVFQVIAGERRFRASSMAGRETIDARVLTDVSDKEALRLAVLENQDRADVDVLDQAASIVALEAEGYTQVEIAGMYHCSQPQVAARKKLLTLPIEVQRMLDAGALQATHARALSRYSDWPALCILMAEFAVSHGWTNKELENPFDSWEWRQAAVRAKVVVDFGSYETRPAFEWKEICVKNCPFKAYFDTAGPAFCLKAEHYHELQAQAMSAVEAKAREAGEAARIEAIEKSRQAQEAAREAATKGEKVTAEKELVAARIVEKALEKGLPDLTKLSRQQYETIDKDAPDGCTEDCPCRCKGLYYGRIVDVCMDTGRINTLKGAQTRAQSKDRKLKFARLTERIGAKLVHPEATHGMALIAWRCLQSARIEAKKQVAETLQNAGRMEEVRALLLKRGYDVKEGEAWEVFGKLTTEQLIRLTTAVMLHEELFQQHESKSSRTPMTSWFLKDSDTLAAVFAEEAPSLPSFNEQAAVADFMSEDQALNCARCGDEIAFEAGVALDTMAEANPGRAGYRLPDGHLLSGTGAPYCPDCAPNVAVCRCCGCTDEAGCQDGCWWVQKDLCSRCAGPMEILNAHVEHIASKSSAVADDPQSEEPTDLSDAPEAA